MQRIKTSRVGSAPSADSLGDVVFIKIGTTSIVRHGLLGSRYVVDRRVLGDLARDIAAHWGRQTAFGDNTKFVVVTSGARELGRITPDDDPRTAAGRGQPKLLASYNRYFGRQRRVGRLLGREQVHVEQLLVESSHIHDDPETGVSTAIIRALRENTLVVINENDPLATKETTLGDNDKAVADIAVRLGRREEVSVKAVVIMSRKNGNGNGTSMGRGGASSKAEAVRVLRSEGIDPLVVDGKDRRIIRRLLRKTGAAYDDAAIAARKVEGRS